MPAILSVAFDQTVGAKPPAEWSLSVTTIQALEVRARILAALIQPYVSSGKLVPLDLEMALKRLVRETEVCNDDN